MDVPGNANKHKQTGPEEKKAAPTEKKEKEIKKVVTGSAVEKKKSFGSKIKDVFVGADLKTSAMYIATNVLLPSLRNLVVDAVTEGTKRIVYGDDPSRRPIGGLGSSRIQYNRPSTGLFASQQTGIFTQQGPLAVSRPQSVNDIILNTKEDAETALIELNQIINDYQVASVADFKGLVGVQSTFVENQWGWSTIDFFDIRQVRDGWLVILPKPQPIS